MNSPFFSIIIPTHNRANVIQRCIGSCLDQTYQNFEILVIDDASNDETEEIVHAVFDSRIRYIKCAHGGAAAARNIGIRLAKGEYIAFLDSDDVFLSEKLEVNREHILETKADLVYSQTFVDRGVGRMWIMPTRGLESDENIFDYIFIHRGIVPMYTIVVDTGLAQSSPFREDLSFGDDDQFVADLWLHGAKIKMIEQPLTIYEDYSNPNRLSQSPVFHSSTTKHVRFFEWVESHKSHMSKRAYLAYRARFYSRYHMHTSALGAMKDIWLAYKNNALNTPDTIRQIIQTFTPRIYRYCADFVASHAGKNQPYISHG